MRGVAWGRDLVGAELLLPEKVAQFGIDRIESVGRTGKDNVFEALGVDDAADEERLTEGGCGLAGLTELHLPQKFEAARNRIDGEAKLILLPAALAWVAAGHGPVILLFLCICQSDKANREAKSSEPSCELFVHVSIPLRVLLELQLMDS